MTKRDLVNLIYLKTNVSKRDITETVDALFDTIIESVSSGKKIELRGFGTFYLSEKKSRQVFSPIAGKKVDVAAGYNLAFKPSKTTRIHHNDKGD